MNPKHARYLVQGTIVVALLLFTSQFVVYIVDQREMAVVLQFGKPVRAATKPGLYFKIPFIESVRTLPATLQFWGDTDGELLPDLPTKDDKKIQLIPWAVWKVNDPIVFVTRLRTLENAEQRVAQFTRGAMRDVITQYELEDLVRSTNRELKTAQLDLSSVDAALDALPEGVEIPHEKKKVSTHVVGREAILDKINNEARNRLVDSTQAESQARGIELIDVGISSIDFVSSVRMKTFERWKAERDAISTRNVTEGERLKKEILNMTNAEVERIQGDGQRLASEIRGKADAEIIKRYADAISVTGDFFTFVRTLEAYEKSFSDKTQIVLTTDNAFLHQLQRLNSPGITPTPPTMLTPVVPAAQKSNPTVEITPASASTPTTSAPAVNAPTSNAPTPSGPATAIETSPSPINTPPNGSQSDTTDPVNP